MSKSSRPARGNRQSPFGDQPLEPLSVKLLQAAGVLSLLLILVVVNSFLQSPENPLNPVAAAAERTEGVDGLRFTMKVRTASEAHPTESERASGVLNLQTKLGVLHYNGPTDEGARASVDMVIGEDAIYVRSSELRGKLPEGKEWAKMDPALADSEHSTPANNPGSSLGMLTASERVHPAGRARVRGTRVSRYVTNFEISAASAELRAEGEDDLADECERLASQVVGPVHAEAFVDDKGFMRRIQISMVSTASGAPETVDTKMDFFAFDSHPEIQVPPEGLVFDMSPLLEKQQEALGQAS